MSSRKTAGRRGTTKKRAQRATSNVFAMFNQDQIQEFKEAFNMIDQNRDGFIDKEDLHDMLASLGKDPTDEYLDAMMNEAPGAINFTMFLTLFGERLQGKYKSLTIIFGWTGGFFLSSVLMEYLITKFNCYRN